MLAVTVHNNESFKEIYIDQEAIDSLRLSFNPSGIEQVATLKLLAGAFYSYCNEVAQLNPAAGRELAVAKTNMQTASMWAVLGATKGSP